MAGHGVPHFSGASSGVEGLKVRSRIVEVSRGNKSQGSMNPEILGFFDRKLPAGQTRQTSAFGGNTWMRFGVTFDNRVSER